MTDKSCADRSAITAGTAKNGVEVPKDAGAAEPVRFTKEQAAKIEAKHSLTMLAESDTIKKELVLAEVIINYNHLELLQILEAIYFQRKQRGNCLIEKKKLLIIALKQHFYLAQTGQNFFKNMEMLVAYHSIQKNWR